VHGDDRVTGVVLTAEQAGLLELCQLGFDGVELLGDLGVERVVFQGGEVREVLYVGFQLAKALELTLRAAVLGRHRRRATVVVPEARLLHLTLEPGDLLLERRRVKDSPRAA
jgi:hypothetical protein